MKCRGILGLLLGHQFIKSKGGYWHRNGHCFRCGMPLGGRD